MPYPNPFIFQSGAFGLTAPPPQTHGLVADINTALEQQVLDVPQTQRIPNVHHHNQADDLG